MKISHLVGLLTLATCFASCATSEKTYGTKKGNTVTIHHVRKVRGGTVDRTETLTPHTLKPAEVDVYDVGRMPDGNGGMHEAHEYYRIVQSETFDLRLPPAGKTKQSRGPKTIFTPPNYSPPPQSQRLTDALAEAQDAKAKLDATREKMEQQAQADQVALQNLQSQTQDLQGQFQAAMGAAAHPSPVPSPTTDASKAGVQAADPLAQWGQNTKP